MKKDRKTEQLQIRVSPSQKLAIKQQASKAQMKMSHWILSKVLPSPQLGFQDLVAELAASETPSYALAELLELLGPMSPDEFELTVSEPPEAELDPYWKNYLAATVEHAAALKHAKSPSWTQDVRPLDEPAFGSSLKSLKLHLLVNSPPAFIARNIFIDSNVGDRV
jgi:uncharacterized protein (DUF1778 family)